MTETDCQHAQVSLAVRLCVEAFGHIAKLLGLCLL